MPQPGLADPLVRKLADGIRTSADGKRVWSSKRRKVCLQTGDFDEKNESGAERGNQKTNRSSAFSGELRKHC